MYKITVPVLITNGFNREKTLAELKRCGAQRVALAVERELKYAFSSEKNLKLLKELISYYRENGLETIVWVGETFGHEGTPAVENSKYNHIHHINGGKIKAICPTDETFTEECCEWIKKIAACGADVILLDDDLRLTYRGGVGCVCDNHMKMLCEELDEKIERSEITTKVFRGGKNKYRDAWLKTQGDSVYCFAKKLRAALDEVNPDAKIGFCLSVPSWDLEGWDVLEMAKILAGKGKPFIRLMGAPYWADKFGDFRMSEVVEMERNQLTYCEGKDIEVITEGDTWPRPRHQCPAGYLECFDMILRADGRSDGILKYMIDYISEADYETGYVDVAVENEGIYELIDKHFNGKICVGVKPVNLLDTIATAEFSEKDDVVEKLMDYSYPPSLRFSALNSLPTAYEGDGVNILFGENARHVDLEILKNGNVIDLVAAKRLMERGIDVGIEVINGISANNRGGMFGRPKEYHIAEDNCTYLNDGVDLSEIVHKPNVTVISKFVIGSMNIDCVFAYENADGMRFLVYPFDAAQARKCWGWFENYSRKRQLEKWIEWAGKKPLDAYIEGNFPRLYTITKKNETGLSVGIWNMFEDKAKNVKINVGYEFKDVEFLNCSGHIEGNSIILDSILYPYEFAGVIVK